MRKEADKREMLSREENEFERGEGQPLRLLRRSRKTTTTKKTAKTTWRRKKAGTEGRK